MATEIKIPIPDQTTEEVRIVKWCKNPAEPVTKGEVVLEVETDKSVMEVEAIDSGVLLHQKYEVDDMVPVGEVVGFIGQAGEAVPGGEASKAAPLAPVAAAAPVAAVAAPVGNTAVKASPVARKVAADKGVDLGQVSGSGVHGKVMRADVDGFGQGGGRLFVSPNARRLAGELGVDVAQVAGTGPHGRIVGADVELYAASAPSAAPVAAISASAGEVVALTRMRKAIGKNLQYSSRETPHFNVTMAIDMTRAMQVRTWLNQGKEKPQKVSVNDLVIKACAVALKKFPAVNSRLGEQDVTYLADINIGVAIAMDAGLVVPVLSDADKCTWGEMAVETKRLASEARSGKIIGGGKGTFTVSNLGMFGVDNFTAIINPPESAILAVGGIKDEVVAIDGMITIKPMMKATLCSDHRVIDGALAAQFLQTVKTYLEVEIG